MCKKTCNTAIELQSALSQIGDLQRRIDNQRKTIGEHQGDTRKQRHQIEQLAEQIDAAAALAANLRRERDEYRGLAEERAGTIADLRGRGILRQVFALEEEVEQVRGQLTEMTAERDNLTRDLEARKTAHASDSIELMARREECERLRVLLAEMTTDRNAQVEARDDFQEVVNEWMQQAQQERLAKIATRDQRDEETKARQRVQIELDKANAKITELSGPAELRLDLKVAREQLKVAEHQIGQLQTHAEQLTRDRDRALELAGDLRREQRTMTTADYGMTDGIPVMGAAVCHCDDLQERLANLHRAGKDVLLGMTMNGKAVTFIEALTRAGDCLEELVGE